VFGIAAAKFRVLLKPIETSVENSDRIVKAVVALYNFLIDESVEHPPEGEPLPSPYLSLIYFIFQKWPTRRDKKMASGVSKSDLWSRWRGQAEPASQERGRGFKRHSHISSLMRGKLGGKTG
jgi:hypothetical protein